MRFVTCCCVAVLLFFAGCESESSTGPDAASDVGPELELDATLTDADAVSSFEGGDLYEAADEITEDLPDLTEGTVPASFTVRPGVESVTVLDAEPEVPLTLYARTGEALVTIITDVHGQAHFSYIGTEHITIASGEGTEIPIAEGHTLRPGRGYVIRNDDADPPEASEPFTVLGVHDTPDPSFYEGHELQGIHYSLYGVVSGEDAADGFNYLPMRDGVLLSAMVRFPDPLLYGDGPYPTLIEYSGYSTSRPDGLDPGSRIANLLGYATVGVNMRGTGCSGGVFDIFNPAQHADGYDIVEIVARQPWAKFGQVGMVGLSYSGIAQLFVARTNPPSLAAVTPQSVIADPWQQLWPGGIYNDGFTRQWIENRDSSAASGGQSWTHKRIEAGDTICEEHQVLRNQNIDFESFFRLLQFYPDDAKDRSLPLLVSEIECPVYLTGAWQDEQTGSLFANMIDRFTSARTAKFTMYNGRHPDGYSPLVLTRWFEFLEFYVARRVPLLPAYMYDLAGPELAKEFGVEGLSFEPNRFEAYEGDYEGGLAAYEAEARYRVLFENGAAGPEPGAPRARFETTFDAWPPPDARPWTLYLGPEGTLGDDPAEAAGEASYLFDPEAGADTFFGPKGYQLMVPLWDIDWHTFPEGRAVAFTTAPLAEDTVVVGPGYAVLNVASEATEADVQVTLTEVRPDDTEVLLQSGWLRLGHRKVDEAASDTFRKVHSFRAEDYQPLVPGESVEATVAIYPFGAPLRAGTRLRMTISSPGRNHGTWEFEPPEYAEGVEPLQTISWGPETLSRLVLPVIDGVEVPPGFPECPSLRGQPCR